LAVGIAVDSINKLILGIRIFSFERTILVAAERFLSLLVKDYGKHSLSTDGGGTWYSYTLVNS
jgi:putative transposase